MRKLNKTRLQSWLIGAVIIAPAFATLAVSLAVIQAAALLFAIGLEGIILYDAKQVTLGSRKLYIPLLVITVSMLASAVQRQDISTALMGVYLFGLYLAARALGTEIFRPFAWAVVITAASVVATSAIISFREPNGGFADNYNIAVGLMLFGAIAARSKCQWVLITVAAVGMFFSGAEEGIFTAGTMLLVVLIRKDVGWRLLAPVGVVIIIAVLGMTPFSYTRTIYHHPIEKITVALGRPISPTATPLPAGQLPPPPATVETPPAITQPSAPDADYYFNRRTLMLSNGLRDIKPLGSGYKMYPDNDTEYPVHNVPLIIVQQIGPIAAAAWLFVLSLSLIKSRLKYALIALLALCVFDHYIWTQVGGWWWALIGISSVSSEGANYMFRSVKN